MFLVVDFLVQGFVSASIGVIFYQKLKYDQTLELDKIKNTMQGDQAAIRCLLSKAVDCENMMDRMNAHLNDKIQRLENKLDAEINGEYHNITTH